MWRIFRLFIIFLIFALYNVYYFIIIPKAVSTIEEAISAIDELNMPEEIEQNRDLENESTNKSIDNESNSSIRFGNNTNSEQNFSSSQFYDRHIFYKTTANNINHPIQDFIGNSLSQFISTIEIDKAKEHFLFNNISSEENNFQADSLEKMSSTRRLALVNNRGFAKIHLKDQHPIYNIINFGIKVNDPSQKIYGVEAILLFQDMNSCIKKAENIKLEYDIIYSSAYKEASYTDNYGNVDITQGESIKDINSISDKELSSIRYSYVFDESGVDIGIICDSYKDGIGSLRLPKEADHGIPEDQIVHMRIQFYQLEYSSWVYEAVSSAQ